LFSNRVISYDNFFCKMAGSPYRWVPPSQVMGAQNKAVTKTTIKDFFAKHKTLLLVAGGVVLGLLIWYLWSRHRAGALVRQPNTVRRGIVGGASANTAMSGKVGNRLKGSSTTTGKVGSRLRGADATPAAPAVSNVATTVATAATMTGQTTGIGQLCGQNLPKPMNVYMDNLVGANDITVGPGVSPFVGTGAAVPVDYAGQCTGVNPAAVWQSTQLLPSNCGQSLEGTSDWDIYAPSNAALTSFVGWQQLGGQDTVLTTNKNASLDLRPEPQVTVGCFQAPWGQSSWVQDAPMKTDWSHSLVA
jgi:hypothetical protein